VQQLFLVKSAKKETHSTWMEKHCKHFSQNLMMPSFSGEARVQGAQRPCRGAGCPEKFLLLFLPAAAGGKLEK
jgi:hypothetical protein